MQSTSSVLQRPVGKLVSGLLTVAVALGLASGLVSNASAATGGIAITGAVAPTITLTLPTPAVAFGSLTPDNTGTRSSGVTGIYDGSAGSTYTYAVAGDVMVRSNKAWTGSIAATNFAGPAGVAAGDLRVVATTGGGSLGAPLDFSGPKKDNAYHHDYSVRVDWTDDTGSFTTTITYTVSNG